MVVLASVPGDPVLVVVGRLDSLRQNQCVSDARAHWERIYLEREPESLSWYQPAPETSYSLIEEAGLPREAGIPHRYTNHDVSRTFPELT